MLTQWSKPSKGQPFYQAVVVGTREPEEREPGNEVGSPEVQDHLVFTTILHLSEQTGFVCISADQCTT